MSFLTRWFRKVRTLPPSSTHQGQYSLTNVPHPATEQHIAPSLHSHNLAHIDVQAEPEDYEQILASLAIDIQKRQTRLSEIRLRERRATLLVTLYALAVWGAYVSVWYMGLLPSFQTLGMRRPGSEQGYQARERAEKLMKGVPVFVGPVLCVFILFL